MWADDSSKIVQICTKNINIVEFHVYICNHNEDYIQISTNIPDVGLVFWEIDVNLSEIWENRITNGGVLSGLSNFAQFIWGL